MQVLTKEKERNRVSTVLFGSYMPFIGVKYYSLFDEQAVCECKNKTGAIGWRIGKTSVKTVPRMLP